MCRMNSRIQLEWRPQLEAVAPIHPLDVLYLAWKVFLKMNQLPSCKIWEKSHKMFGIPLRNLEEP